MVITGSRQCQAHSCTECKEQEKHKVHAECVTESGPRTMFNFNFSNGSRSSKRLRRNYTDFKLDTTIGSKFLDFDKIKRYLPGRDLGGGHGNKDLSRRKNLPLAHSIRIPHSNANETSSDTFGRSGSGKLMPSRAQETTRSFFKDSSDKDSGGSGRFLTPTSRRRITLDDSFTINQLRFSSLGLYGREKDFDTLKVAFKNVGSTNSKRGLVLLSGHAGTGKSALVESFLVELNKSFETNSVPYFARGKFDLNKNQEPYSAFISALTELCNNILALETKDRDSFLRTRDSIRDCLGDESEILLQLMPNIKELFEGDDAVNSTADLQDLEISKRKHRFNILICRFFQAVCEHGQQVVLYLDDLQWADTASLELIETILKDQNLSNLLLLGCYRNNEVHQEHPLYTTVKNIENTEKAIELDKKLCITRICIGNLLPDDVHSLIKDLLSMEHEETEGLAKIVFEKTNGNALFVVQYLSTLRDEKLLQYNVGKMCWVWDAEEIRKGTNITENVVDLLKVKLEKKLPHYARKVLQLAACLGSTFDEFVIVLLVESMVDKELSKDAKKEIATTTERDLRCCVSEGFLLDVSRRPREGKKEKVYRFVHDEIQLATYMLIPSETRDQLQIQMGNILVDKLDKSELDKAIFVVVKLLESASNAITDTKRRTWLARLNFQAGKKAKESSAFDSSEKYLSRAVDLLGPECWDNDYALSLEIFNLILQVECCNSKFESVQERANEIIARANGRIQDSIIAYKVLGESLHAQGRYEDSLDIYLKCLSRVGCEFPKKLVQVAVLSELKKTKELLKVSPPPTMLELPPMEDEVRILAMVIMDRTASSAFLLAGRSGKTVYTYFCILISCKVMQWTVEYGLHKYSAQALMSYAWLHILLYQDIEGARTLLNVAQQMDSRIGSPQSRSTICNVKFLVSSWIMPLKETRKTSLEGYRFGVEYGDNHAAITNAYQFIATETQTGSNLSGVKEDIATYSQQMIELKQTFILPETMVYMIWVKNLMGDSDSSSTLDVDLMASGATQNLLPPPEMRSPKMRVLELQQAVYFGDYQLAASLLKVASHSHLQKSAPGIPLVWRTAMFEGITAFVTARKSKGLQRLKWKIHGIRVVKKVSTWATIGNTNCLHIAHLLQGEQNALDGKIEDAKQKYDTAISIARRNGLHNDVALARERAGEMYLDAGDLEWGTYYIESACTAYREWGALGKVNQMLQKYDNLLN